MLFLLFKLAFAVSTINGCQEVLLLRREVRLVKLGAPPRRRLAIAATPTSLFLLLLDVLLAFVLEQAEVLMHLLQSVMLTIERMNDMIIL